jgi:hypothetical protein
MSSPKKNQATAGIQALILHSRVRDKLQTELSMNSNSNKQNKKSKTVSTLKSKQFLQHNRKPSDSIDDNDDDEEEEEEEAGSAEITVIRTTSHSNKKLNDLKNNNKSLSKSTNNNNNNNNNSNLDTSLLKIKSLEILNEELMEQNKSLKQQLLVSQANCSLILNELTRSKKKLNQILKKL